MRRDESRLLAAHLDRTLRRLAVQAEEKARSLSYGHATSVIAGRGVEVAGVREYQPGDEVRGIDWRVTARKGRLHVKEFAGEKDLPVLVVLDSSPTLPAGRSGVKACRAREVASILLALALREGHRAGLLHEGVGPGTVGRPRGGRSQLLRLLSSLLDHQGPVSPQPLSALLETAARVMRAAGRLFLVSDFQSPPGEAEALKGPLSRLAGRHRVTPVWIRDEREGRFPARGRLFLREPGEAGWTRVAGGDGGLAEALEEERTRVAALFRELGLEPWAVPVDRPVVESLRSRMMPSTPGARWSRGPGLRPGRRRWRD